MLQVKMLLIFYFVVVILFIGSSIGKKETLEVDPDKFRYWGDPVVFACVHEKSQSEFKIIKSNNKTGMPDLIKTLSNGNDLSLFIHAIGISINGYDYDDAQGWFDASGSNICYLTYPFVGSPTTLRKLIPHTKQMMDTNRFEFVAKQARDLVLNVRDNCAKSKHGVKNMTQIVMVGFSFGAHIAGQACRYITAKTGEKVKTLIGLDPASASLFLKRRNYIQEGDASYVQLIHTSKIIGSSERSGDIDIIVKDNRLSVFNPRDKHALATSIHAATSRKKLIIIADMSKQDLERSSIAKKAAQSSKKNQKGSLIEVKDPKDYEGPELQDNECMVGVYSEFKPIMNRKIFEVNLVNRSYILRNSLNY